MLPNQRIIFFLHKIWKARFLGGNTGVLRSRSEPACLHDDFVNNEGSADLTKKVKQNVIRTVMELLKQNPEHSERPTGFGNNFASAHLLHYSWNNLLFESDWDWRHGDRRQSHPETRTLLFLLLTTTPGDMRTTRGCFLRGWFGTFCYICSTVRQTFWAIHYGSGAARSGKFFRIHVWILLKVSDPNP